MPPVRKKVCCVRNCPARNAANLPNFSIPADLERRLQWLKLIGRLDLYQKRRRFKNYVVCAIHFDKSQIDDGKQARPDVFPTRNVPRTRKGVFIYSSNTRSQTDLPYSDDDIGDENGFVHSLDDEKVVVYKRLKPNRGIFAFCEIDYQKSNFDGSEINEVPYAFMSQSENCPYDSVDSSNRKIFVIADEKESNDASAPSKVNSIENDKNSNINTCRAFSMNDDNPVFKKFAKLRTRTIDVRNEKCEKDFIMFALHLHTINMRAYKLLVDSWNLPKEDELKKIKLNIGPKFDERVTMLLRQKFKMFSTKAKFCTVGVYAMPLKPHIYYDPANDELIGIHNVDGVKKINAANYALVAMARGLKVEWCQPVAFSFFASLSDPDSIDSFLTNVVVKLKTMDLKVLGVVLPNDLFFWKYCRSKYFISPVKNYLSIARDKLYVVFDIPHVLNMFLDEFMGNDYLFDNKAVSWKYLKKAYDVDKDRENRLLPKLKEGHMKMGSKDKSVNRPSEVLSKTVCGAMHFYIQHGLLEEEAEPTAELVKKINDAIDVMNVNKALKGIRHDTQSKLVSTQTKAIDAGCAIFKKLARIVKDKEEKTQEPDSLKYFPISFKALSSITFTLKDAKQLGLVQTSVTYLDRMLLFLKSIKADSKTSKPTPIKFARSFSRLFLKYLVDLTPSSIGNMEDFLKMAYNINDFDSVNSGKRIRLKDKDHKFELPETYPIIYISSFLLHKCAEKHKCKDFDAYYNCLAELRRTKVYAHFEKFNKKAAFYYKLKFPPIELPAYVERLDNCFLKYFGLVFDSIPAVTIYMHLQNVNPWSPPCSCFPLDYMLKLFVRTRIYETVLQNTRQLKEKCVNYETYTLKTKKL